MSLEAVVAREDARLHKLRQNAYERARKRRRLFKERAVNYLGNMCYHCKGTFHHAAMQFHHTNPSDKDFHVAQNFDRRWDVIQAELDKCILLCSNCHAIHHYEMNNT